MTPRGKRIGLVFLIVGILAVLISPFVYLGAQIVAPPRQLTSPQRDCGQLSDFTSEEALIDHLGDARTSGPWLFQGELLAGSGSDMARTTTYSGTNVQVQGVDEADIVKTDGTNVYAASYGFDGAQTSIVRAVPAWDMGVLAKIPSSGWSPQLFVAGDRLVVIDGGYGGVIYRDAVFPVWEPQTSIFVYDVADPASPKLLRNVTVSGSYLGARMIGDIVYLIASAYLWVENQGGVVLPTIWTDGDARPLTYADTGYFRDSYGSSVDTLIVALNVRTDAPPEFESFLTNGAAQLYVSGDHAYIAGTEWVYRQDTVVVEMSAIHKVALAGGLPRYLCSALVPGSLLNQFSMDEHEGNLRVATTFGQWTPEGRETSAGVYVLDGAMNPTGQVTGLAPGERVYSSRFLGDRAYLVTYRQVDPLFVIDVSNPHSPQVLGYLKIPGVSDYLHPYGTNHLIGFGRNDPDGTGRLHGLKVSLFDVSDVEHPVEVDAYVVGGGDNEYAYSEAQYDHKAFTFVPDRDLIVFPAYVMHWTGEYMPFVFSGAYVISVTPSGFALRGTVSHETGGDDWSNPVRRSLYIGDILYTVSNGFVVANQMDTLEEVGRVAF